MKIILVADLHVHNWREFSVPSKDGDAWSRLRDCVSVLSDILEYCLTHQIGTVVIAGDLFHKRGVVYTQPYNLVVNELAQFREHDITVLMIDGNHDHADKVGRVHVVSALEKSRLVQSIDPLFGYENWQLYDKYGDSLVISGLSYCDSASLFERRLADAEKEYGENYAGIPRVFVCHHGFKDARVGTTLEYIVKEDIDATKMFRDLSFDHVFSGHYHAQQLIGGNEDMLYIGSPLQHMRGEGREDKGFLVYDSKTRQTQLVALQRPKFVTLNQEDIDNDDLAGVIEDNFVDVRYETLPKSPEDYQAYLYKHGARGVKLARLIKKTAATTKRLDVDLAMDEKTLLNKYLDFKKDDIEGQDRDELLRIGKELLDESDP